MFQKQSKSSVSLFSLFFSLYLVFQRSEIVLESDALATCRKCQAIEFGTQAVETLMMVEDETAAIGNGDSQNFPCGRSSLFLFHFLSLSSSFLLGPAILPQLSRILPLSANNIVKLSPFSFLFPNLTTTFLSL